MFCQYKYYRIDTEKLQTMVDHSDERYQCKKISDCPFTGTTVINNIPWGDWPAGENDGETSGEEDSEREDRENEMMEENETRARQQGESTTAKKPGLMNKLKRLFRK